MSGYGTALNLCVTMLWLYLFFFSHVGVRWGVLCVVSILGLVEFFYVCAF